MTCLRSFPDPVHGHQVVTGCTLSGCRALLGLAQTMPLSSPRMEKRPGGVTSSAPQTAAPVEDHERPPAAASASFAVNLIPVLVGNAVTPPWRILNASPS